MHSEKKQRIYIFFKYNFSLEKCGKRIMMDEWKELRMNKRKQQTVGRYFTENQQKL